MWRMGLDLALTGCVLFAVPGCHPYRRGGLDANARSLQSLGGVAGTFDEPCKDPWLPWTPNARGAGVAHCGPWVRDDAPQYRSIQVNVDHRGCNIAGDAANEPTIAIDPTDPRRVVIGWRQFDTVESGFRQAGWAYSHDAGHTWVFPGSIDPGVFHSDPVLDVDAEGDFYFSGLAEDLQHCDLFRSLDGGVSWQPGVRNWTSDKPWMVIDRTESAGHGNIYTCCVGCLLLRSTDGGLTFDTSPDYTPIWGTMTVGPDGTLYAAGREGWFRKSTSARDPGATPVFEFSTIADLGGRLVASQEPNRGGLLGQVWVAMDQSGGPTRGNLYRLSSVRPPTGDPLDVMFTSSADDGLTWSAPVRVNADPEGNGAWQWFGMMSVAPNGRIDAVWNDTRNYPGIRDANLCELYYSYSTDAGVTWSTNIPVSPMFDSYLPFPDWPWKLGDYYHMISDNLGVNVAYAATFNGEHDVYFLRIGPWDCNGNEVPDEDDIACGGGNTCEDRQGSYDCNGNGVPDECEYRGDFDGDGLTTLRDVAALQRCFTGDADPIDDLCCHLFDLDEDDRITIADLPPLERILAGP